MSAQAVAADAQPRAVRAEPKPRPVLDGGDEQAIRGARAARAPKPVTDARRTLRTLWARVNSRAVRTHFGTVAGVVILGVLVWRMGTGVVVDGLRRVDGPTVLAALGIGVVTTVFSAWRWCLVARGLKIRLPLGPAVADYYRSLFLNAALPGGVLGDVHRAVRHGQSAGDLGRGVRAVVLERVAGQVALMAAAWGRPADAALAGSGPDPAPRRGVRHRAGARRDDRGRGRGTAEGLVALVAPHAPSAQRAHRGA